MLFAATEPLFRMAALNDGSAHSAPLRDTAAPSFGTLLARTTPAGSPAGSTAQAPASEEVEAGGRQSTPERPSPTGTGTPQGQPQSVSQPGHDGPGEEDQDSPLPDQQHDTAVDTTQPQQGPAHRGRLRGSRIRGIRAVPSSKATADALANEQVAAGNAAAGQDTPGQIEDVPTESVPANATVQQDIAPKDAAADLPSEAGPADLLPPVVSAEGESLAASTPAHLVESLDASPATAQAPFAGDVAADASEGIGAELATLEGKRTTNQPEHSTSSNRRRIPDPGFQARDGDLAAAFPARGAVSGQATSPLAGTHPQATAATSGAVQALQSAVDTPTEGKSRVTARPQADAEVHGAVDSAREIVLRADRLDTTNAPRTLQFPSPISLPPHDVHRAAAGRQGPHLSEVERVRLLQRVVRALHTAGDQGGLLRLRLSPPELGSVQLEVSVRDGAMHAHLSTDTAMARTLLLDHLPALRERLAEMGVRLERFDVDLSNAGTEGQGRPPQDHERGPLPAYRPRTSRGGAERIPAVSLRARTHGLDVLV